jgi:hypothetical protein
MASLYVIVGTIFVRQSSAGMFVEIDNDILLRSEIEKNFKNDVRWKAIYFDLEKLLYTSCPKESPRFVPILTSEGKKIQF